MRCKAGDLALIIEGEGTGMMVTCVAPVQSRWIHTAVGPRLIGEPGAAWHVDREIPWYDRAVEPNILVMASVALDRCLMPINPLNDEQDATPTEVNHEVSV